MRLYAGLVIEHPADLIVMVEHVLVQVDLEAEFAGAEREALRDECAGLLGLTVHGSVLDLRTTADVGEGGYRGRRWGGDWPDRHTVWLKVRDQQNGLSLGTESDLAAAAGAPLGAK